VFFLVPAYPGCPGTKAVKRLLLLMLLEHQASAARRAADEMMKGQGMCKTNVEIQTFCKIK